MKVRRGGGGTCNPYRVCNDNQTDMGKMSPSNNILKTTIVKSRVNMLRKALNQYMYICYKIDLESRLDN